MLLAVCTLFGQKFPIRHLGSIGHLEGKPPVNLGTVRAASVHASYARLDGRDRAGKPWRAWMRTFGGIVGTEVWAADFDRNGQDDLLVARHFAANGWCPAPVDVVILLFDSGGRPVPWKLHSQSPPASANERYPFEPIAVIDSNRDGRAEFVSLACTSPFDNHPLGQSWIDGTYSAKDARLGVVKSPDLKAYRARVGPLAARPAEWQDLRPDPESKTWEQIESLAKGEIGCKEFQPPPLTLPVLGPGRNWCSLTPRTPARPPKTRRLSSRDAARMRGQRTSSLTDPTVAISGSRTGRKVAPRDCERSSAEAIPCAGSTMDSFGPMRPGHVPPK